ncbi:MAG: lytic transglycosylase domain-containing protein [Halobacteriovoraceae bacterium]|nr:lytic transglycosylase domain-containing protein [Halobacteriovoraceae bacterium]
MLLSTLICSYKFGKRTLCPLVEHFPTKIIKNELLLLRKYIKFNFNQNNLNQKITHKKHNYYQFNAPEGSFNKFNLEALSEFDKSELKMAIVSALPNVLKFRAYKYIPKLLEECEKQQVDPLWAFSIMWVESHFKTLALSHVGAQGLMQVMPYTANYLATKIDSEQLKIDRRSFNPFTNIEMGVHYLKELINTFEGSYRFATVAYNMGPFRVKDRLKKKLPVGVRNKYLSKVRLAHKKIEGALIEAHIAKRPRTSQTLYMAKK